MGIDEILGEQRAAILALASKHGVKSILVFGSVARGEAGPESDVDFLVKPGPRCPPFFPGGLLRDLEDLLGRHVDVVVEGGLHPLLRKPILDEAVPL